MNVITKYFKNISEVQLAQFEFLKGHYEEWNEKINVISRKDMDNFYERHVLHSLSIAKYISFKDGTKLLDLGCGGGFPSVPLAIMFPNIEILAVDSIGKKLTIINDLIEKLELKNLKTQHCRVEQVTGQYDFVVTRAVAPMIDLIQWTRGKYHPIQFNDKNNGIIMLKGGDLSEEIKSANRKVVGKPLSEFFKEEFFDTKFVTYIEMVK
jgi:16S rRNA (guanine527-N7)-methyltransferase